MAIHMEDIVSKDSGPEHTSLFEPKGDQKSAIFMRDIFSSFRKPVKFNDLLFFTTQLSLMLEIDTPVTTALKTIAEEISNPAFKSVVKVMCRDIEEGFQLSDAMARHPRVFDHQFISMVRAGETGGFLSKILDRIVGMQEKRQALVTQLRAALTYPLMLFGLGFVVILFIVTGVLPKFEAFFMGKEALLPWTTRFLMASSSSLQHYWWVYILSTVMVTIVIMIWVKTSQGKIFVDTVLVRGPIISGLMNKVYTCEMLRTMGNLVESHVPLLEALHVTGPTIRNMYFQQFVDDIRKNVDQGGRFAQPFGNYPYISQTVKQMIRVGEEVGKLPVIMLRLARFYDTEIEQDLKKITAMIEPAALIFMGSAIGLIVSSIILPLFKLSQALH